MPFPKPPQKQPPRPNAYRPVLKQRHIDRVLEMAEESGRDPTELMHEALDHVLKYNNTPPIAATAPPPPDVPTMSRANESPLARRARHDAVNAAVGREDGDPESAMAALEAREAKGEKEGDTDEAPPEMMRGDAPNPLGLSTIKQWASGKVPETPSFLKEQGRKEPESDDERRASLRRKYLAPSGRVQRRG